MGPFTFKSYLNIFIIISVEAVLQIIPLVVIFLNIPEYTDNDVWQLSQSVFKNVLLIVDNKLHLTSLYAKHSVFG